jgi:benzoate membrane transport protein
MRSSFSFQAAATGVLITFVGFASTFAVIVEGLTKMGASPVQASSGLMAVTVAMGLGGLILSLATKMPISVAWSTPGAALLASSSALPDGFSGAVGAFLVTGALITLAGLFKPLGRAVAAIPHPLGNAMLAGVLFGLCLAPVKAVAAYPVYGLAVIVAWVAVARIKRILAMPAAVLVTVVVVLLNARHGGSGGAAFHLASLWPAPVLVTPTFSLAGLIGIAIPLFLVTMASQNIPGIAVLAVNGYKPDAGKMFAATGILSVLAAPFGSHAVNLAAITAALGAGPDAHPDPARRYWATATSGALYILVGLLAGAATAFIASSPPLLVEAVAGLALLGAFGSAVMGAVAEPRDREAAVITFVVTASGVGFLGISGAFWGLLAGGAMLALARWRRAA